MTFLQGVRRRYGIREKPPDDDRRFLVVFWRRSLLWSTVSTVSVYTYHIILYFCRRPDKVAATAAVSFCTKAETGRGQRTCTGNSITGRFYPHVCKCTRGCTFDAAGLASILTACLTAPHGHRRRRAELTQKLSRFFVVHTIG